MHIAVQVYDFVDKHIRHLDGDLRVLREEVNEEREELGLGPDETASGRLGLQLPHAVRSGSQCFSAHLYLCTLELAGAALQACASCRIPRVFRVGEQLSWSQVPPAVCFTFVTKLKSRNNPSSPQINHTVSHGHHPRVSLRLRYQVF